MEEVIVQEEADAKNTELEAKRSELIDKLKEEYKLLTSLTIQCGQDEDTIVLYGVRYRGTKGQPSRAQIDYLKGLPNVKYISTSNLMKSNKWFLSSCINIAKDNEDWTFKVDIC